VRCRRTYVLINTSSPKIVDIFARLFVIESMLLWGFKPLISATAEHPEAGQMPPG
jgi:hypothetical protein